MFSFLKRNKKRAKGSQPDSDNQKEWTFVWYKKMVNGNKTHFTQPFRTTVIARTRHEALDKVKDFAMRKMELIIMDEKDFGKDEFVRLKAEFHKINGEFEKMFKNFPKF